MGIAVRLWTSEDLQKVLDGDKWLTTLLANAGTFSLEMIKVQNRIRDRIKCYAAFWNGDVEPTTLYATDDEMVMKFIEADYVCHPENLMEVITEYRTMIPQPTTA